MFHKNLLSPKTPPTQNQNPAGLALVRNPAHAGASSQNQLAALLLIAAGALSLTLLAASVATEFSAQRWLKAHP